MRGKAVTVDNMALPPVFSESGERQTGGYFRLILPAGCDPKFLCKHCGLILRDPIQSQCGHRFCRSCRDEILITNAIVDCPACLEEQVDEHEMGQLSMNEMFPDNAVKREMSNMQVCCVFPGCNWKGRFKDYESHERNCQFKQLACALCSQPVTDGQLEEHRLHSCLQRDVACDYCNTHLVYSRLQSHLETCSQVLMTCDKCGRSGIRRELLSSHLEESCPKRIVSCPVGCVDKFQQDKFSAHLSELLAEHLEWTVTKLVGLENKVEQTLGAGTIIPQSQLTPIMEDIKNLEKKVQNFERQIQQLIQSKSSAVGGAAGDNSMSAEVAAKASLKLVEPILGVIHNEVDTAIHALQTLEGHYRQQQAQLDEIENQFRIQQQQIQLKDAAFADLEMRLAAQEMARHDGTILWKVSGFEAKKRDAISGQTTSLYSPAFYSGPCGYKMCARIYPNGDGIGKNSHISLFFVIMRGHFDALLPWPFSQKVTLMMIDQNHKEHIVDAFKPDPSSSSFKRPTTEMNIASGCPLFLPLEKLQSRQHGYLRDDTIFVKIIVDTDGLDRYTEMNPGRFATGYP
ncbi:TNF receptor-associated factor 2-like isoform X2 [Physella acuta]|uniref:TNF receptor-associated factor 2-like isoform X2 n=1 Tax=Physella acuta TaxID=109671 RepID=UPI0027DE025A|nr:TNF receptor-associated factor 2-like isoform X2 [Physella acuta]